MRLLVFLVFSSSLSFSAQGRRNPYRKCDTNASCVLARDCPATQPILMSGLRPVLCGFQDELPMVCCHGGGMSTVNLTMVSKTAPSDGKNNGPENDPEETFSFQIAKRKCCKFVEPVTLSGHECHDDIEVKVIGGKDAPPKRFPHMAMIGYGSNPGEWRCAGSLISENFVLSAAHCSSKAGYLPQWARLGELNKARDDDDAQPVDVRIVQRFLHPKHTIHYNDIALFKLKESIQFSHYIRPACLSENFKDHFKLEVIATGWGKTNCKYASCDSNHLQEVTLDLTEPEVCKKAYARGFYAHLLPRGVSPAIHLCAGSLGKDTCKGDSGGPLQIVIPKTKYGYYIIGITAFGPDPCAQEIPAIYTKVKHFIPWIVKTVWPDEMKPLNLSNNYWGRGP